ncbi:DNA excision repair protein ERCC-6-like isoform X1 [Hylaeus anthracinus]|uniref:DNA excision repair protein ERCC-6-like isoform X1 n=1 Tax=Hylaeus anthracinus TaxID=313031 RepID=UPI0023B9EE30|nr:DNA excision repair protein ERCC-6-like isoform X1 [Hylaeus anthracinus]XP_054007936.1 DNA excision repair protein ERCC-6-like isoform X1 [Hylaeus anthracinus]
METDDQDGQEPDDEKQSEIHVCKSIENFSDKILSVRSEESILREASKEIENITKINLQGKKEFHSLSTDKNDEGNVNCQKQVELEKQVLTGEITPFQAIAKRSTSSKVEGISDKSSQLLILEKYLQRQAELATHRKQLKKSSKVSSDKDQVLPSKRSKLSDTSPKKCSIEKSKLNNNKKKLILEFEEDKDSNKQNDINFGTENAQSMQVNEPSKGSSKNTLIACSTSKNITGQVANKGTDNIEFIDTVNDSGSDYAPSDEQVNSEDELESSSKKRKCGTKIVRTKRVLDDGDEQIYRQRVEESNRPKNEPLHKIDNLFKTPLSIWKKLYRYQRVSVQWLWELHCRGLGGLLGDEMGLGKTVQVIAFLAGLDCSELLSDGGRFRGLGPTLIVCPATLMEQWLKHFHDWWPVLRVVILHQSGTYNGDLKYLLDSLMYGGILITSYSGVLNHKDLLIASQWHYVILDEGHKIRNPQAKISKAVKQFSTPHRLLLTGSPMQNSLKELWSLFDFILPGKLGTLPAFLEHCAIPITRGGYTNASPLQEATALQVATMLRDAITPYMLRRTKADVQHHVSLPEKNEQVLFCSLTEEQKQIYKNYLRSDDVSFVLHEKCPMENRKYKARLLIALSALRKICNHPDLFLYTTFVDSDEEIDASDETLEKFGYWKRSGKMVVVRSLLKIWKKQGHRVLLFTQGRQMMHVLESLVQNEEYKYLRLDGTTPMTQRQETISLFNSDPSYFVFLLTTRVGGLGVNLTGANRVIIYDPDWNPATDAQARERAWRIGQNKSVTIYRLITAGTIEEKIYHRQIFKLLLSNKVLEDPRQRRLFKTSDLAELFNFNESIDGTSSESDQLFRESRLSPTTSKFSSTKIEKMRKLAATLSKNISRNVLNSTPTMPSTTVLENTSVLSLNNNGNTENNLKYNNQVSVDKLTEEKTEIESHLRNKSKDTGEGNTEENKSSEKIQNNLPNIHDIVDNNNVIENENLTRKHKRKKKHSRSKESAVSAMFEGERVSHLIGRRLGGSTNRTTSTKDDQYVLEKLFAKATVTSAFQHESVLSNSAYSSGDKTPMQRLARETAQEKMDNIRKSRKWCWRPTWDSTSSKDN